MRSTPRGSHRDHASCPAGALRTASSLARGHAANGAVVVAAEKVAPGTMAQGLFDGSRKALEKQGWTIGRVDRQPNKVLVEAQLDHGKRLARQLYLVEEGFAYVVTLVAPAAQQAERTRDFDETVASLRLDAGEDDRK